VEFEVLGPLRVNGGDIALPAKQRILLAVLLLHANRVVPVDALIDAMWDDAPPSTARTTLQGYVKQLRQNADIRVGGRVVTRSPGYQITVAADELDLDRFTGLCDRARSAAADGDWAGAAGLFGDALALWRGDPLADIPSAKVHRTEVPRLAELRMQAAEFRVDADLRLGRHGALVAELRQLTGAQPLREGLHGQLMVALYRCGRQADALEVFRGIDERLRGELGISPGPGLQQLHQRILAADASLAAPPVPPAAGPRPAGLPVVPAQLPPDTADFTGRDEQVKLLCGLLGSPPDRERPGAVAISAVAGMGGIGKTALAVHVAHRLRSRFPDGQLYGNLQGATSPLRPAQVLTRFLRDLGEPDAAIPVRQEERAARYRSLLADRKVLVVLDDVRDAAQVRPLLPGSSGCAVIVTTRGVLPGLAGATQLNLDAMGMAEARSLFTTIVGASRAAGEPEATTAVLASCAGLPLAVRIAGTRLATRPGWSIARMAAWLADERRRLAELATGDLAVRASFAVSYEALRTGLADGPRGADPARVFRLLGLPSGMTVLSLPAIAALAGQPAPLVTAALEALTDAHLLESPAPDRYRLHDLLRSYAAELADTDSTEEREAAVGRIMRWYGGQAVALNRVLAPATRFPVVVSGHATPSPITTDPAEALEWYEAELANLGDAASQAADRGLPVVAAQIAVAMWTFFQRTSHAEACVAVSEAGVRGARLGDDAALSSALIVLGWAYIQAKRMADADRCLIEALEIQRRTGDRIGESRALNCLGISLINQARLEEAIDCQRRSLDILTDIGEQRSIDAAIVLNNLGESLRCLNRYEEALVPLNQSLAIRLEIGDPSGFGTALTETTIGQTYLGLGRYEDAVGHCRRALAGQRGIARDSIPEVEALCCLGDALAALGRAEEARDAWRCALPILDRLRDPRAAGLRGRLTDSGWAGMR
jgi:DNA-binding SARP family transcriptional activator/tetratricopeptide (TPR) repeat protein